MEHQLRETNQSHHKYNSNHNIKEKPQHNSPGIPRIDLSGWIEDSAALYLGPAVHRLGEGDLGVQLVLGDAEGLVADVLVHRDGVQALGVGAV